MNVYLDPEPNKLKYPCKMCHRKSCAVTKAYLLLRRLTKREPSYSLKVGPQLFVSLQLLFSSSHLTIDPWYQRLWKSITRIFRFREKETFTHVDMIECMNGKPLSDKSIQDCLFNNPPSFPERTLPGLIDSMNGKPVFLQLPSEKQILFENYWMSINCTPENEESVKDSID
ncbi:hypothetical protein TNCV_3994461 [Trichonephila clavipes]|nr:hypothetical protein TNCV_3994461 [Trichonephila clavipes]